MSSLLGTLLDLLDQIHEVKKQNCILEHQGKNGEENTLYLENVIEKAAFELQLLKSNLEFLTAQNAEEPCLE